MLPNYKTTKQSMKKCSVILPLAFAAAVNVSAHPTLTDNTSAKDSTKVIDIEEVVVIATPKENTRLRRQPLSSASFSQNEMRGQTMTSVKSLTGFVPNLFIPDYGSKLTTSVYVRGVGSRINTPAIGLYVDNIPFIEKAAFDFNYSDIERIDVLRGPQGTLYGRNTMGGLIRVFTKSPFHYQGTDVRLSAATRNEYKASLTHYHRVNSKFAFSSGFFYEHKGGFFKNDYNGKHIDSGDEFGGRMRAIYLPDDKNKFDFTVNYEYVNQGGYPYEYTGMANGKTEDRGEYIGRIAYNRDCGYKRNLLNAGVNIEHQEEKFTLNSVTGFQYLRDRMDLDQDFTEQDIYSMMQKQNSKTLSEELVLKAKSDARWQWITGISGFYQWLNTEGPVTFHADGMNWLNTTINSNANQYLPDVTMGSMTMKFHFSDVINGESLPISGEFSTPTLNAALFHQSTLNDLFGVDGLSATVGLRLDYEKLKLGYKAAYALTHTYSLSGTLSPADRHIQMIPETTFDAAGNYEGNLTHDYLQLLPKFAVTYEFNRHSNIYASASRGYRSGGFNIQNFSDLLSTDMQTAIMKDVAETTIPVIENVGMIPSDTKATVLEIMNRFKNAESQSDVKSATLYEPEYSWNYEIGSHLTLFDGKLQADVAGFLMDVRNQQISRFADKGLGRETVNAGKSRSWGGEASVKAQITDDLSLSGNYGYTYATFTNGDYEGKYVPFVPKHTFCVGGQYIFRFSRSKWLDNITLNAHYRAAGRIYWTEENNASQALYGTLNGRISVNKGNSQIALWANNILNKDYQAFYFETMGRGFMQSGRPIQAGIDIRYCF